MKWIRTLHQCLGCLFAPLLIFFCASGAWQLFGLHRAAGVDGLAVQRSIYARELMD